MNRKSIITALFAIVATAGQGSIHYRIEGNVGMPDFTGWLYIQNQTDEEPETVDSLWVEAGEIRPCDFKAGKPFVALLHSRDSQVRFHPLFVEQGTIHIVDAPMTMRGGAFYGTPLNDEWRQYYHDTESLSREYDEGRATKVEAFRRLDSISEPLVRRHHDDVLGAYVTSMMIGLGTDRMLQYVGMLSRRMQGSPIVYTTVSPFLTARKTAEGQPFIDFEVEYDGCKHRLSDYVGRGQYVLADFWASWCGPCRAEIPHIIAAYDKYKEKGLQVVGIAAWDNPDATLRAIEEEKIPYPQILNTQSVATDLYGINGIPHIILFAPDGTILARGLRGEKLATALAKIFE